MKLEARNADAFIHFVSEVSSLYLTVDPGQWYKDTSVSNFELKFIKSGVCMMVEGREPLGNRQACCHALLHWDLGHHLMRMAVRLGN